MKNSLFYSVTLHLNFYKPIPIVPLMPLQLILKSVSGVFKLSLLQTEKLFNGTILILFFLENRHVIGSLSLSDSLF